ncbi:helix-turn-helix domain-containing protein [Actinomadura logoneensis]|nr:helix-turn-helix transcriptional regulator [Actinomadura logoneensis]
MADDPSYTRDPLLRSFGRVMRSHREAAGLSRPQLADELGCGATWIEKLETGRKPPSEATADDCDFRFGTTRTRTFWTMWDEIKREGKHVAVPPGFERYVDLEGRAVAVRKFDTMAVPGLLQTPAYARAVLSLRESLEVLDDRTEARLARQNILSREGPPRLWFVLEEAVLRRPIGGSAVMREQLEWLVHLSTTKQFINVRVLPFAAMNAGAVEGSFTILTMGNGDEIGYHEGPEISNVIDDPAIVSEYALRWDEVVSEAMTGSQSHEFILAAAEEYK